MKTKFIRYILSGLWGSFCVTITGNIWIGLAVLISGYAMFITNDYLRERDNR